MLGRLRETRTEMWSRKTNMQQHAVTALKSFSYRELSWFMKLNFDHAVLPDGRGCGMVIWFCRFLKLKMTLKFFLKNPYDDLKPLSCSWKIMSGRKFSAVFDSFQYLITWLLWPRIVHPPSLQFPSLTTASASAACWWSRSCPGGWVAPPRRWPGWRRAGWRGARRSRGSWTCSAAPSWTSGWHCDEPAGCWRVEKFVFVCLSLPLSSKLH